MNLTVTGQNFEITDAIKKKFKQNKVNKCKNFFKKKN